MLRSGSKYSNARLPALYPILGPRTLPSCAIAGSSKSRQVVMLMEYLKVLLICKINVGLDNGYGIDEIFGKIQ